MYIRTLPRSRRSRNRRRSGRWKRCAILDRQWVSPRATIGLYLLDDKRRETERAVGRDGEPIALTPTSSEFDLLHAIRPYGEGRYRLVARNRKGHILARRDFVAAVVRHRLDVASHEPRTEVERLKAELAAARDEAETARAERDAAKAEAQALAEAVAERDAEIAGLEAALDQQGQALRRARRLYAELGSGDAVGRQVGEADEHEEGGDLEGAEQEQSRLRRRDHTEQRRSAANGAERNAGSAREPPLLGLRRAEWKEGVGLLKDLLRDEPASSPRSGTDEPAEGEASDGDEAGP